MSRSSIRLSVPARPEHLAATRAAVMAASGRLSVDHVEDLGLAVGEAAGELVRLADGGRLTISANVGESVTVDVSVDSVRNEDASRGWGDAFTRLVLERLTTRLERRTTASGATISFAFPAG